MSKHAFSPRHLRRAAISIVASLALAPAGTAFFRPLQDAPAAEAPAATVVSKPETSEPLEVERVVDGDTIYVRRGDEVLKLRLLCVDTEEKLSTNMTSAPSKPQTVYGEECAIWAREFFASLAGEDGKTRVRLVYPSGREERDVYGRILCHLLLPDGTDFNLKLVREGRSPYFEKYGRCRIEHAAFVAAQEAARAAKIGIWDPKTNEPAEPGAPAAKRPYERLLPWWHARAEAVEDYRNRHAQKPTEVIAADDGAALEGALASGASVLVFGEPEKLFEEEDGSLAVLFRSGGKLALRVRVPAERRGDHEPLDVPALLEDYRQNYVYVRGVLRKGARGPELVSESPDQWRRAGPEPAN